MQIMRVPCWQSIVEKLLAWMGIEPTSFESFLKCALQIFFHESHTVFFGWESLVLFLATRGQRLPGAAGFEPWTGPARIQTWTLRFPA